MLAYNKYLKYPVSQLIRELTIWLGDYHDGVKIRHCWRLTRPSAAWQTSDNHALQHERATMGAQTIIHHKARYLGRRGRHVSRHDRFTINSSPIVPEIAHSSMLESLALSADLLYPPDSSRRTYDINGTSIVAGFNSYCKVPVIHSLFLGSFNW